MKIAAVLLFVAMILTATIIALAEPVETEIPHVSAEVAELRTSGGVTRLAVRYVNGGAAERWSDRFEATKVVLVDVKSKQKHLPIKDANNQFVAGPIGDEIGGGRIYVKLPPGGQAVAWVYFDPIPAGTVVSVELPQMFPFEDVAVTDGAGTLLSAGAAQSTPMGAVATLVSAKRADEALKVRLKITSETGKVYRRSSYFEYKDVYLFDPASKRKYPILRDAEGNLAAQPQRAAGTGNFLPNFSQPILMSLTFQAPPDDVTGVDLVLPDFLPMEAAPIEGLGGAAAGGIAAAGKTLGLEGALKELAAEVTAEEIKIDLSADVLFDFDKADLKPVAEEKLNNLLTVVNSRPSFAVSIEGHTDIRGDAAYNQSLSLRRAESVRAWLTSHGVAADRLGATGAGESRPLRSGEMEADHQANRRVEIRMTGTAAAGTTGPQPATVADVASGSPSATVAAAEPQSAIKLQPGTWRLRVSSITNGVADPAQDTEVCISAEELSDLGSYFAPVLEDVDADCKKTRQPSADPNKIDYRMACIAPKITVNSMSQVMIESINRFDLAMVIDSRTEIETGHVEVSAQANWVRPCD